MLLEVLHKSQHARILETQADCFWQVVSHQWDPHCGELAKLTLHVTAVVGFVQMWPAMLFWLNIGKWFFEIVPSESSPFISGRAIDESD